MLRKYQKKAMKFFAKHPNYNAFVHAIAGIGVGILLAYPLAKTHPIRWAVFFVFLSVLGHLWATEQEK